MPVLDYIRNHKMNAEQKEDIKEYAARAGVTAYCNQYDAESLHLYTGSAHITTSWYGEAFTFINRQGSTK